MPNDHANVDPLDLWSLLAEESNGNAPSNASGSQREEHTSLRQASPNVGGEEGSAPEQTARVTSASSEALPWQVERGDWREALRVLQDALARSPLTGSEGETAQCSGIAPEEVADAMREVLPEIAWRVLALLDQIPARGAIRLTPLRPLVAQEGTCDLCGDALADPHHFPPRCERCGLAARLALGYLSLTELLCSGR
jgi:hypothetical protein